MRTLKFKPQPTVYVFRYRQPSKRTSWKTEAQFSQVKRSSLSVMIGRFRSILFVSVFQGSLPVAIILIDGNKKPNRQLGFELHSSHVCQNRNKTTKCSFHATITKRRKQRQCNECRRNSPFRKLAYRLEKSAPQRKQPVQLANNQTIISAKHPL